MMTFTLKTIGFLHTPFKTLENMPIQPMSKKSENGFAEVFPPFQAGLKHLNLFSHVILIYVFHCQNKTDLTVTPFLDSIEHGVFATRAPSRPNHIGVSIVPLLKIEGNRLFLENLDMLDGSPLLDIKPYVPEFDHYENASSGWLRKGDHSGKISDNRFTAT